MFGPLLVEPDTVREPENNELIWYHRNSGPSEWENTLKHQQLTDTLKTMKDPIRNRTFGGVLRGASFRAQDRMTLVSDKPGTAHVLSIHLLTEVTDTVDLWVKALRAVAEQNDRLDIDSARARHRDWWSQFWDRSWIRTRAPRPRATPTRVDGNPGKPIQFFADSDHQGLARAYANQRYLTACGGRGRYPIKFNGSIFNVSMVEPRRQKRDRKRMDFKPPIMDCCIACPPIVFAENKSPVARLPDAGCRGTCT